MAKFVFVWWTRKALGICVCGILLVAAVFCLATREAVTTIVSRATAFSDTVVVIDPGHGGADPGAIGKSGLLEKELTLDISRKLAAVFEKAGIKAFLTREDDIDFADETHVGFTSGKRQDLQTRLDFSTDKGGDLLLSIHANSFPESIWSGAQTFHYFDREEDRLLACAIQSSLVKDLGPNNRQAKAADIYILRKCDVPAVTVEVGFLSNPREEELLKGDDYKDRVAHSIYSGVIDYLQAKEAREKGKPDANGSDETKRDADVMATVSDISTLLGPKDDEIILYFAGATNQDDGLIPELRKIAERRDDLGVTKLARVILDELEKGPGEGSVLQRTIPKALGSNWVNWIAFRRGILYVDLSDGIVRKFWGGSRSEELTVFSIVDSLTHIPGVAAVKLSIDGKDNATIGGHILLDEVLGRRDALISLSQ